MLRFAVTIGGVLAVLYFVLPAGTFPDPVPGLADRFDKRPVRPMLFIGNSRTYYNDMPAMLRKMADSAHAKDRFDIVTRALPAGTLQLSWNDPGLAVCSSNLGTTWSCRPKATRRAARKRRHSFSITANG
jgi:hypothetical protein